MAEDYFTAGGGLDAEPPDHDLELDGEVGESGKGG